MSAWGASPADAAVSVTFDNLGEAAQLELGMWPDDVPHGEHFTVLEVLPRLLELLAARGVRATFFVEGLNAEMYPGALRELAQAWHEVAVHAWRHEEWAALDAATEATLLDRATDAMRSIGLEPRGFRPPGGGLSAHTLSLLGERGYSYVSPAGRRAGTLDGLAVLPFRWQLVDAYAFLPQFAGLRERYRGDPEPYGPEQMGEEMIAALRAHAERQGHLALLFHPFAVAFTGESGWAALDAVLAQAAHLSTAGALATPRMDEAAAWMLTHAGDFNHPPQLDDATWMAPSA
jgi:peptidoglycan/xylan/chitin deacetylase (PgdA/CDA1 family)